MSVFIPRYLVGRNAVLFAGGAMYINPDGSIVPGGDFADFHSLGVFDTFDITFDFGLEEISATDMVIESYSQTKASFDCNVGEIQQPSGASKLMSIGFTQSSYLGIEVVTQDPVTGAQVDVSVVGIFGSLKQGVVQGKNVVMANIKPCGIFPYYGVTSAGSGSGTSGGLNSGSIRPYVVPTSKHP